MKKDKTKSKSKTNPYSEPPAVRSTPVKDKYAKACAQKTALITIITILLLVIAGGTYAALITKATLNIAADLIDNAATFDFGDDEFDYDDEEEFDWGDDEYWMDNYDDDAQQFIEQEQEFWEQQEPVGYVNEDGSVSFIGNEDVEYNGYEYSTDGAAFDATFVGE